MTEKENNSESNYNSRESELAREIEWAWREEIAKYLPQINYMSFMGPSSIIPWVFEHVDLKPDIKKEAEKLISVEQSELSSEEKAHHKIKIMFPRLNNSQNH